MIRINFARARQNAGFSKRHNDSRSSPRPSLRWTLFILAWVCAASVLATSGCSYQTPAQVTPIPDPGGVAKSFFSETFTENVTTQDPVYDEKGRLLKAAKVETRTMLRPKTFLCGWTPISEAGEISQSMLLHQVHMAGHCNVEFEITKNALIARLINPSFPTDRNRWQQILTIGIKKHFYFEKAKDSSGRETNEWIENDSRSDWSARPQMTLDFDQISFTTSGINSADGPGSITNSSDVEWDTPRGFLGFTLNARGGAMTEYGSTEYEGRFRVNFLRFDHNPNFKATPYSSSNAAFLNALHILGEVQEGDRPILYAARWDMTKAHKIYTHGMPKDIQPIAKAVVDSWNDVFEKQLGLPRAFELSFESKNKYGFDLRYPSMTWVSDMAISLQSPLGVGMTLADVKNGEILWGNITLWGGYLERYIKAYLPSTQGANAESGLTLGKTEPVQIAPLGNGFFQLPQQLLAPPEIRGLNPSSTSRAQLIELLARTAPGQVAESSVTSGAIAGERKPVLRSDTESSANQILADLKLAADTTTSRTPEAFAKLDLAKLLNVPQATAEAQANALGKQFDKLRSQEISSKMQAKALSAAKHASGGVIFDLDRRFVDSAPGWAAALQAANGKKDYDTVYRTVVRELLTHEYGHMLGLGHQFKENILPVSGTVPPKHLDRLNEDAKNLTNATSVMGYKHPATEVDEEGGDRIVPGPQDVLVLRYLYKAEYATYRPNSGDSDFTFFPLPANGKIPKRHPEKSEYVTSYFPQCNDFHASLSVDPYCNRFDRGYSPETIVKSYFNDLNSNLVSSIYAFADVSGGNSWRAERYLWYKSLTTMGRVRLFYDYMRQKFATQINSIATSQKDLYEFSRVCSGEIQGSARLQRMFRNSDGAETELGELCRVNRLAIREFTNFLVNPGPDRTRMDWDNNYIPASMTGGDARIDSSHAFGTFTALSVLPLKLSALNALTTTQPYFFYGPWMLPVFRYADEQGLFSYGTLYPYEFTQAMASTVEKNLKFGSGQSGDMTTLGYSVLTMGGFLSQLSFSNDSNRFPKEYLETIRDQTGFRLNMVAVIMNLKGREETSSGVMNATHFSTQIFDFRAGKMIDGSESYILPGGKVIVRGPNRSFVFPVTTFSWLDDRSGYVLAYRVDYDDKHDDVLASHSVKTSFEKLHKSVIDSCLVGQNNGLASFFRSQEKATDFPGFKVLAGVSRDKEMQIRFLESVQENFNSYYRIREGTSSEACEQSLKGLGLIVSSAAVINGYFLPEALDYILK